MIDIFFYGWLVCTRILSLCLYCDIVHPMSSIQTFRHLSPSIHLLACSVISKTSGFLMSDSFLALSMSITFLFTLSPFIFLLSFSAKAFKRFSIRWEKVIMKLRILSSNSIDVCLWDSLTFLLSKKKKRRKMENEFGTLLLEEYYI